jgi:hypothetical protein
MPRSSEVSLRLFFYFVLYFSLRECDSCSCDADETRGPVTSSLKAGGHLEIAPVDARLGGGHKVAQAKASPRQDLDIIGLAVSPPAAESIACGQICGLLIQRLEDVNSFFYCHFVLELQRYKYNSSCLLFAGSFLIEDG